MKLDMEYKGNIIIDMDSDGDFYVDIDGVNNNTDWVADNEESSGSYYYYFRLNDFIGDLILLKCKINDLFQYFRSSKTYIMKDICEVFEKLETNCVSENFQHDVYINHGNQSYEASFDLKPSDETAAIKLEIENLEHRKDYYESQINDYKNIVRECNEKIQELNAKLESNA